MVKGKRWFAFKWDNLLIDNAIFTIVISAYGGDYVLFLVQY